MNTPLNSPSDIPAYDHRAALALASTPEGRQMRRSRWSQTEATLLAATQAFVQKAKQSGLHPHHWAVGTESISDNDKSPRPPSNLTGVMQPYLSGPHTAKSLALLSAEGCTPWVGNSTSRYSYHNSQPTPATLGVASPEWIVSVLGGDDMGQAAKKAFVGAAIKHCPPDLRAAFLDSLLQRYASATKSSSKTSKGVMGAADREARNMALLVDMSAMDLLDLAGSLEDESKIKKSKAAVASMLKDAKERLAAKLDKAAAVVNPEKIKKALAPEQKTRLLALMSLCRDFSTDHELIAIGVQSTGWLALNPMAACVNISGKGNLLGAVLGSGSPGALAYLEKVGANLWLAAAQGGAANACEWAWRGRRLPPAGQPDVNLAVVARMLLIGSYLDGAEDPKARCLELANQAIKENQNNRYAQGGDSLAALTAEIERQTLTELIQASEADAAALGLEAEERPRRRSNSL